MTKPAKLNHPLIKAGGINIYEKPSYEKPSVQKEAQGSQVWTPSSARPAARPSSARFRKALRDIPAGTTLSYGALAQRIGTPAAVRAVGLANAANPIGLELCPAIG